MWVPTVQPFAEEVPIEHPAFEDDDSLRPDLSIPRDEEASIRNEPDERAGDQPEWRVLAEAHPVPEPAVGNVVENSENNDDQPQDDPSMMTDLLRDGLRMMMLAIWAQTSLLCVVVTFAWTITVYIHITWPTRSTVITTIRSDLYSQKCADLSTASNQTDQLIQWDCHAKDNQKFIFEPVQETRYRIKVLATQRCLQIVSGSKDDEALVVQGDCNDELHQLWTVSGLGGYQRIKVAHMENMCINIQGASKDRGANLVQWPCLEGSPWRTDFWRADDLLASQ